MYFNAGIGEMPVRLAEDRDIMMGKQPLVAFAREEFTVPIHDWTRVDAGIFHDFHHEWISTIKRALNAGLLPPDHYALAEQIAGGLGPDVLTLQVPANGPAVGGRSGGGIALATAPPKVHYHAQTEMDIYAAKAKAVVVRHASDHRVIAVIEIVSPGNKNNRHGLRAFVDKAAELLRGGIHLLIVDLFPPGPRDPQGIHRAIWDEFIDSDFTLPPGPAADIGGLYQRSVQGSIRGADRRGPAAEGDAAVPGAGRARPCAAGTDLSIGLGGGAGLLAERAPERRVGDVVRMRFQAPTEWRTDRSPPVQGFIRRQAALASTVNNAPSAPLLSFSSASTASGVPICSSTITARCTCT